MNAAQALAAVALVAGRYALHAVSNVHITMDHGENGCMPTARLDFEDLPDGKTLEIDLLAGDDDAEAFRGLVELAIFKHRNPGATP